mgnify:FL=1
MSDTSEEVNLKIKNSTVLSQNLIISSPSHVDNENLVLEKETDFVERFSPEIMKPNDTMQSLYGCQKEEMQNLHYSIKNTINNNFISEINLDGIIKWEKLLDLEVNAELDLNTRKELILVKRRFRPPFTRQNLQKILESVWGDGNYTFEIYPNEFQIIIDIHTNYPEVYLKFQDYIRSLIPANIYVIFSVQYTYLYLNHTYTYNDLSTLTYRELSKYA